MRIRSGRAVLWMLVLFALLNHATFAMGALASANAGPIPIRALHFVLAPAGAKAHALDYDSADRILKSAKRYGFNVVIVQLADSIKLDSVPELTRHNAWSKGKLQTFVKAAGTLGVELIPEIKFLTHQEKFFQRHFEKLMYNKSTYDPRKEETYRLVYAVLDEVIATMHPKAIHIGHDEVAGYNDRSAKKWLRDGEKVLPADLFLQDVSHLHGYLKQRGIETWMWGDMLIAPDEIPGMIVHQSHGTAQGYGRAMREKLPRDIVICDGHYSQSQPDFPSLAVFKREGFRVLGATWRNEKTIRNFSHYAAMQGSDGMIATTWFYVPRKEWNVVDEIIRYSGKIFSQDFPGCQLKMSPIMPSRPNATKPEVYVNSSDSYAIAIALNYTLYSGLL